MIRRRTACASRSTWDTTCTATGRGVSYGVTCRMINTYSITEWENEQLPGLGANVVSMMIRHPAKLLRLTVTLLSSLIDPNPEVVCQRIESYPLMDLDKDGFAELGNWKTIWPKDQEMTQHEQGCLKRTNNTWTLEISKPMVGFRYDISWRVKTPGIEAPLRLRGKTDQLRRSLLSLLDTSLPDKLAKVKALGQTMLDEVFQTLLLPDFRSKYAHDEGLVAAIFAIPGAIPGGTSFPSCACCMIAGRAGIYTAGATRSH